MSRVSTVSVNDDFSASKTSVSLWTTNYETASWVDEDSSIYEEFRWDHRLDDVLVNVALDRRGINVRRVLRADQNGADALRLAAARQIR